MDNTIIDIDSDTGLGIEIKKNYEVLLVDDISENLQVLGDILNSQGLELNFATSGKMALENIAINIPDLILLDVNMPNMDGFEVCEKIKQNPNYKDIPIIFLTARSQTEDIVRGFELGAVDFVTKPFNASELISRVFTHLELKKAKDIIKLQNEKLRELVNTKDKFFSIIAHDLKSPFNGLIGLTELINTLYESMDTESLKNSISDLNYTAKKMVNLIENLLEWARNQTNMIECKPIKVSVFELVDDTVQILINSANDKNISIYNDINYDMKCFADPNMIKTVLRNLIANAIKYTREGGSVTITAIKKDNFLEVTVSDDGIGISNDDINRLFRIDVKFTMNGTKNEQGTGLGLIICKDFIEKNGGNIWVKSKLNHGSDFKFTLPM